MKQGMKIDEQAKEKRNAACLKSQKHHQEEGKTARKQEQS